MEARNEIEALVTEFAWRVDHHEFASVPELFTEDGRFDSPQRSMHGRAALEEGLGSRVGSTLQTRHVVSNLRLVPESEERVRGWVTFTVYRHDGDGIGTPDPAAVGEYQDVYQRGPDGRWRFAERRVTQVFARPA